MFSFEIPQLGAGVWFRTATWQQPLQHRVVSDGSRVNCSTLDQTYWFPSTGTAILWALSVLPWQNDYFFIISLIFHHYCTSTSCRPLPTALPRGNYATDVFRFPLRRRSTCQGSSMLHRTSIYTMWCFEYWAFVSVSASAGLPMLMMLRCWDWWQDLFIGLSCTSIFLILGLSKLTQ